MSFSRSASAPSACWSAEFPVRRDATPLKGGAAGALSLAEGARGEAGGRAVCNPINVCQFRNFPGDGDEQVNYPEAAPCGGWQGRVPSLLEIPVVSLRLYFNKLI